MAMAATLPVLLTPTGSWFTHYWMVWLALVVGLFLPPELYAVFTGHYGWTLSNNMWRWEHLDFTRPYDLAQWTVFRWFFVAFFTWLYLHLCFGLVR